MDSRRIRALLVSLMIVLSACAGGDEATRPEITRALLPPAEAAAADGISTTTTRASLNPSEADQLARTEVRAVLAAAEEIYAERVSYDADLGTVSMLADGVQVVDLEDAALNDAVAYDAHDQRLTLHRQSASGRWFCIDVTDEGKDHGVGDSFEQALEACTDGVQAAGWGDVFSPTGSDEAAITALLRSLAGAITSGDGDSAHATFDPEIACSPAELQTLWPDGLVLAIDGEFELESVTIGGKEATAAVSFGHLSETEWPLIKRGTDWFNSSDPCLVFAELAAAGVDTAAREMLERGLFAVRSTYVVETSFAFAPGVLADRDADLIVVPADEVAFGTVAYLGGETEGLLITAAGAEQFYCAVESSFATTVYGEGSAIGDVDSVGRCKAHSTP